MRLRPAPFFRPQWFVLPIADVRRLAEDNPDVQSWLTEREDLNDPGPVYFRGGQVWTDQSEREARMAESELEEEDGGGIDVEAAMQLGSEIDRALGEFGAEHDSLLRQACRVPADMEELSEVVVCTFLGHTLNRLASDKGREHVVQVVNTMLDQFDRVRTSGEARSGALQ